MNADERRTWALGLVGLVVAGYGLWLLSPVLAPFLFSAVLAYLGDPLAGLAVAHGGPYPDRLGARALAQGDDLAFQFVGLAYKQRALDQADFLVGEETDCRTADAQTVPTRDVLEQARAREAMATAWVTRFIAGFR